MPDSICIPPNSSVQAVGNQTTDYHENDEEGEDHTAYRETIAKSLVQDAINQTVIGVFGVNIRIEVELKTHGFQFHHYFFFNFLGFCGMVGVGFQSCERGRNICSAFQTGISYTSVTVDSG